MAVKPFLTTGIALASAAVIVAGTPTVLPAGATTVTASAPAPTKLSSAKYELTALSDITPQGIVAAYLNGWGDYIGGQYTPEGVVIAPPEQQTDPYFPGINPGIPVYGADGTTVVGYSYNNNGVYLSGVPGVLYYLADNILPGNIDNYYFEAGGLPAAIYVAANEAFGAGSAPAVLAGLIFETPPSALIAAVVTGVASFVPVVPFGNTVVGGGILANEYFAGGLPAVASYLINALLPAAPAPATVTTALAALEERAPTALAAKNGVAAESEDASNVTADTTTVTDDTTTPTKPVKVAKVAKLKNPLADLTAGLKPTLKPGAQSSLAKEVAAGLSGTPSSSDTTDADAPSDNSTKDGTKDTSKGSTKSSHAAHKAAKAKSGGSK
jgi:hypothetical protein